MFEENKKADLQKQYETEKAAAKEKEKKHNKVDRLISQNKDYGKN